MNLTECLIVIRQGALMFSVFFLYSIFNIFLLCLLSFISFLRQMVVFSLLFSILALSFLPILSETVSLYHMQSYSRRGSAIPVHRGFLCSVLHSICLNLVLPSLHIDQIFIPLLNSASRRGSAAHELAQLI